jgi:hypothetical protein
MNAIDKRNGDNGATHTSKTRMFERTRTTVMAHHLSASAMRQWERALTGIVALPAAAALTTAATAIYAAALLERTFEMLEASFAEIGRHAAREDEEAHETWTRETERSSEARA